MATRAFVVEEAGVGIEGGRQNAELDRWAFGAGVGGVLVGRAARKKALRAGQKNRGTEHQGKADLAGRKPM